MLEVPFYSSLPQWGDGRYSPMSIGAAAPAAECPTRSYWWLVLAAGLGAAAGYKMAASSKKGRR